MVSNALLVVAARPEPGAAKTRLSPPLAPAQAARLCEAFLLDTLDLARAVPEARPFLAYPPEGGPDYFHALAPDFQLLCQRGPNLGARLDNALTECLDGGYARAVVVDSASPTLPAEYLSRAFAALAEADGVLGPTDDGGCYLIGLSRPAPRLLREVQMSTPTVARDTLRRAAAEGLEMAELPVWYGIDTPAGLQRLRADLAALPPASAAHTRRALAADRWPMTDG